MDLNSSELSKKASRATKWSLVTQLVAKIISPITTMVLARLLTPADFGVVATAAMVVSFAEVFSDAGFQKYLVQHNYSSNEKLDHGANVAFWTNLFIAVVLWGIVSALCDPIATAVGSTGLGIVLIVSGASIPLMSLVSTQTGLYQRKLDYKTLFFSRVSSATLILFVSVPLAIFGLGYWSMIIGTVASNLYLAIFLTIKSSWKPKLFYSVRILKQMFSFSMWTLLESVSIWATAWVGTFIVGTMLSIDAVGMYKTSLQMANAIIGVVTSTTMPILFSSLSRLQGDRELFEATLYKAQSSLSLVLVPLSLSLFLFRDLAIYIFLGDQWSDASLFLGLYFLTSSIKIVFSNVCSEAYRSLGKPKYSMLVQLLYLVVLVPLFALSADAGWQAFSIAAGLSQVAITVITLVVSSKAISLSPLKMIHGSAGVYVATFSEAVVFFVVRSVLPGGLLVDACLFALFFIVYIGIVLLVPSLKSKLRGALRFMGLGRIAKLIDRSGEAASE